MPVIERLDQKLWCLTLTIEGDYGHEVVCRVA